MIISNRIPARAAVATAAFCFASTVCADYTIRCGSVDGDSTTPAGSRNLVT